MVLPMAHGRIGDALYLHGAKANGLLNALADGAEACVCVTMLDGLILARSALHQSMQYRCAVIRRPGDPRAQLAGSKPRKQSTLRRGVTLDFGGSSVSSRSFGQDPRWPDQ